MKELKSFPECDGHIESILIGYRIAKVSFQTGDCQQLVLIYDDVESLQQYNSIFVDVTKYTITKQENGFIQSIFFHENQSILNICSRFIRIFEVGCADDINCALFDVGTDYIGNQNF